MALLTPAAPVRRPRFHPLQVSGVERLTDEAVAVTFAVPRELWDEYAFLPGQHLTLRATIDGEDVRQSYSICQPRSGRDGMGQLRVASAVVEGGRMSTWLNSSVAPGDEIEVMTPMGSFTCPTQPTAARHHVAIAAGSGITPVLSLIATALEEEPSSRVTLLFGNRRTSTVMFLEELEDLKNRYLSRLTLHLVFSQESTDLPLYGGRIGREKIGEFLGTLVDPTSIDHAFVCGPHGVNDEAEAALLAAGVPAERIHIERFGIPDAAGVKAVQPVREGDAADAQVTIIRDGVQSVIDFHAHQGNVLDAAAAAGLEVPFSCKSGVCCTCRAKLLEGEVRMERNFALEKHEVAAGFVLTCQSHPLTERIVLSFDER
jgi:ring-1,2-phenylacetyl-CoA epoxidase subunit PaaE